MNDTPHDDLKDAVSNALLGIHEGHLETAYKMQCASCDQVAVVHQRPGDPDPDDCVLCGSGEVVWKELQIDDASAKIFQETADPRRDE